LVDSKPNRGGALFIVCVERTTNKQKKQTNDHDQSYISYNKGTMTMKMKPPPSSSLQNKPKRRDRNRNSSIFSSATCRHVLCIVQSVLLIVVCGVYATTQINEIMEGELLKELHVYVNWHKTPAVGGPYEHLFEPHNSDKALPASGQYTQDMDYATGLNALKRIVQKAGRDNKRVRAYGSRWSTTDISYTTEYLVDTYGLDYVKVGVDNPIRDVTTNYRDKSHLLTFAQSGVMVKHCYQALVDKGLTLKTSGTASFVNKEECNVC
jgi:hypothetical protein